MMDEKRIPFCTIAHIDTTSPLWYEVCGSCEATVAAHTNSCGRCRVAFSRGGREHPSATKRLYCLQLSIATDEHLMKVVAFDRAARMLLGCSADQFFDFANLNPLAVESLKDILEGEHFEVILRSPISGRAQHKRVISFAPLVSDFHSAIHILRKLYAHGTPMSKNDQVSTQEL